jgi:PleD family two-component response regulator
MSKPRILIVEDDLDLSEMVSSYFRVQNYDVMTAAWGEEALELAYNHPFDLIMLDIRLPDIDGFELCRQLRTTRKTQDIPIIFLTEKRDRVDKLQGLELGVVDYITKPFDIQELRLRVRNAINRAQMPSTVNPVTDLPEGDLVEEKLTGLLKRSDDWAVLQFSIESLSAFRERYGFVAADDVLRAVTLMVRNAVREYGTEDDFVGHLGPENFIIISDDEAVEDIRDRIERRISQSREYFYPLRDRDSAKQALEEEHLRLTSGIVTQADGPFDDLDALKSALHKSASAAM